MAEIKRLRNILGEAETVLIGPADDYEGCQDALDRIRGELYK